MKKNPYATIKNNAVLTASPEELTLMLYNGSIKFSNQAIQAIESNNMKEAHSKIVRVEKIIEELMITLNHDYEISKNLELIYDYIHRRLVEANAKKDPTIIEEVLGYLRTIRDTWKEAMVIAKKGNRAKQPS